MAAIGPVWDHEHQERDAYTLTQLGCRLRDFPRAVQTSVFYVGGVRQTRIRRESFGEIISAFKHRQRRPKQGHIRLQKLFIAFVCRM